MIEIKCDICGKQDVKINTLILHKKKIDYCNDEKCIEKVGNIKKEFEREVKVQNIYFNAALKQKENELIRNINKGGKLCT